MSYSQPPETTVRGVVPVSAERPVATCEASEPHPMRTWLRSFVDTILGKVPGKASLPLALGGMTQCGISLVLPPKITDHSCPRAQFFEFTRHTHENRCRILLVNSLILSSQFQILIRRRKRGCYNTFYSKHLTVLIQECTVFLVYQTQTRETNVVYYW